MVKLNIQTGYTGLSFLLFNLLLGWLIWFKNKTLLYIFRPLILQRRWLGIFTGVYFVLHFLTYLAKEAFEFTAFEQIWTKNYLIFGFSAFSLLMILTLTSNSLSVRLLKIKRWKNLHRLVYVAFLLMLGHVFQIEKGNLILLAAMIVPLLALQLWRLLSTMRQRIRT
ncbi:MAG: ferric reductase-like transmembrane domain-containing protein [Pseudobdellovibrionaceae bacterium]